MLVAAYFRLFAGKDSQIFLYLKAYCFLPVFYLEDWQFIFFLCRNKRKIRVLH